MIIDNLSTFCWEQALTITGYSTNAGTYGTGYIDLGATDAFALSSNTGYEYLGVGEPLILVTQVAKAALSDAASPHAATAACVLETAHDAAFTSSKTTLITIGTFTAGSAPIGTLFARYLPFASQYFRYLRVAWTVSGTFNAGYLSAFLVKSADLNFAYPSRITID